MTRATADAIRDGLTLGRATTTTSFRDFRSPATRRVPGTARVRIVDLRSTNGIKINGTR